MLAHGTIPAQARVRWMRPCVKKEASGDSATVSPGWFPALKRETSRCRDCAGT